MSESDRTYEVLVVDDDFMVADIHRRFVDATPGFRTVGVVHTAADAVAAVRTLAPDLVLLDVHLPDRSGLDALQRLRSEGNGVAVVVVTAARELDTVRRALHGGAADYLVKPFEYPQLLEKLGNFRRRARALSSSKGMNQSVIDSLFGAPSPSAGPSLPKGLSQETGSLVLRTVREGGEVSASECADLAGLSRVSARRYLEHYASTGVLTVRLEYGRAGRPVHRYRATDST
ncbi:MULTISPECIES: response regulator [unclassified Rhodococcus (in: high G+C Gram-positive bacteria)]|uniref:response regulator n=1 Tax=unclassified Rhodococcus (in: high G+C Gram-positive bacteria) TaxID=192944 RepID=UPI0007BB9D65|nr:MULTISPECIES: response regulator [unclassified Rhodococcus (in: high G+C Gram-positive bacteria)]KZF07447.1 two-component system response regulator [Rhodococcus sp. EPR-147]KZF08132.1 two-component system response regulator [Rhodococcus sp. EPR-279]OZF51574.1 two-component system response regulator [Rhodococcus sp. 14-1411-2a]